MVFNIFLYVTYITMLGIVRGLAHWLTPLPGQGATRCSSLCCCTDAYAQRLKIAIQQYDDDGIMNN